MGVTVVRIMNPHLPHSTSGVTWISSCHSTPCRKGEQAQQAKATCLGLQTISGGSRRILESKEPSQSTILFLQALEQSEAEGLGGTSSHSPTYIAWVLTSHMSGVRKGHRGALDSSRLGPGSSQAS